MTYPQPLHLVLVNPVYECPTAEMRAVLPETVPMQAAIHNSMMSGALVRLACAFEGHPCIEVVYKAIVAIHRNFGSNHVAQHSHVLTYALIHGVIIRRCGWVA